MYNDNQLLQLDKIIETIPREIKKKRRFFNIFLLNFIGKKS